MANEFTTDYPSDLVYRQASGAVHAHALQVPAELTPQAPVQPEPASDFAPTGNTIIVRISEGAKQASRGSEYAQIGAVVRYSDRALGEIQTRLGEIHNALEGIVKKLYPPYPINSPERIELLNQVAALRKQIDALTYPPENKSLARLLGDPNQTPDVGDIALPAPLNGEPLIIAAKPAYSGEGGLNLPDLPLDAGDAEVAEGLARVEAAQEYINKQRGYLYQEAARFFGPDSEAVAADTSLAGRSQLANITSDVPVSIGARTSIEALS